MSNGVMAAGVQPVPGIRRIWWLGNLVFGGAGLAVLVYATLKAAGLVQFAPFGAEEFLQRISGLFLVTLFVERVVEVFISGFRAPREAELQRAAEAAASSPDAQQKLVAFQRGTQRAAFTAAALLGLAAAAVGVRAVGLFIDLPAFQNLPQLQQQAFIAFDMVLTAGLIAGGSDGLHQLMELFVAQLRNAKDRAKAQEVT